VITPFVGEQGGRQVEGATHRAVRTLPEAGQVDPRRVLGRRQVEHRQQFLLRTDVDLHQLGQR
jgi:hypothetical protein